jgi:predicted nucleic acid-binding protein
MDKISQALACIRGQRVYVDTNIFIYFLERHDRYFEGVLPFFQLFNDGLSIAYTGDAVVAETLYKPYQVNDTLRVSEFKEFFNNDEFITVLPHTKKVFELAAELAPKRGMKLIDALHYATAALAGCKFILTNDQGFASSDAIEVILLQDILGK